MADMAKPEPEDIETLAGEYVLGVLSADERRKFEQLAASVSDVAEAQVRWESRLASLNEKYEPISPPASLKAGLDARLFGSTSTASTGGIWNALGFWRGLGLAGTAAAIGLAVYAAQLSGSLTSNQDQLTAAIEQKTEIEQTLLAYEGELADRNQRLGDMEQQLATRSGDLESAQSQVAALQDELLEAQSREQPVLVVSLESGDTDYRFLAVHEEGSDKVRMTLVSGAVETGKDFELWLVEPDKQTVSLGVISPGKSAVELSMEFAEILEAGGLLAVSLEQKGGSPTGVAQGPVLAVGAPQRL
jgi:anti-sigma-K factor RskA